jgi:DNA repair ATPase RecN
MSTELPPPSRFTDLQRASIAARRVDDDRTLGAMQALEAALSTAAPRREQQWRRTVLTALAVLDEATEEEQRNADQPDSLLSDVARTQPRLRTRVRGLRAQYRQLQDGIASIRRELETPDESAVDYPEVRQRLAWLLTALRHHQSRESDLVYEAYYEAFNADITD